METGRRVPVNKIIPFSVVDGPGSRTAIFLQKCNIACKYCHNPETQRICCGCGTCVAKCPAGALTKCGEKILWDKDKCVGCDACIAVCENYASPKITEMTAEEVFEEIGKNLFFIRGITVSGGECSLYPEFLTELFKKVQGQKKTCLLDCNGTIDLRSYPELLDVCDGVMLDVKAWDQKIFTELTGADLSEVVKENLAYLAAAGKLQEVRIVVVPGYTDAKDVLRGVKKTLEQTGKENMDVLIKLIRFRRIGVRGELKDLPSPTDNEMEDLRQTAERLGFSNIRII